jgi:hypothetical protein
MLARDVWREKRAATVTLSAARPDFPSLEISAINASRNGRLIHHPKTTTLSRFLDDYLFCCGYTQTSSFEPGLAV